MDPFLFRILRSFMMAFIMFFSVKSLGLGPGAATISALIPLLLGIVDVMAPSAYSITAMIFILAVVVHVFPDQYKSMKKLMTDSLSEVQMTTAEHAPQPIATATNPVSTGKP